MPLGGDPAVRMPICHTAQPHANQISQFADWQTIFWTIGTCHATIAPVMSSPKVDLRNFFDHCSCARALCHCGGAGLQAMSGQAQAMMAAASKAREAQLGKEMENLKARLWDATNRNSDLEKCRPFTSAPAARPVSASCPFVHLLYTLIHVQIDIVETSLLCALTALKGSPFCQNTAARYTTCFSSIALLARFRSCLITSCYQFD